MILWEKRWFQFTILMILAFIWGSSFILMKDWSYEFQQRPGGSHTHLPGLAGTPKPEWNPLPHFSYHTTVMLRYR